MKTRPSGDDGRGRGRAPAPRPAPRATPISGGADPGRRAARSRSGARAPRSGPSGLAAEAHSGVGANAHEEGVARGRPGRRRR